MSRFRPPAGAQPRGRLRILVADDELIQRRLIQAMLSSHGSCTFATDGTQALTLYEEAWKSNQPFHLACLDILMPGLDGQAVLAAIRAHEHASNIPANRATRVIMISALDDGRTVLKAFRNQCEAYLIKPFEQDELEDRIRRLGLIGPRRDTTTHVYKRK